MDTLFGNISTKQFLADYWQKKPLFVADAFDPAEQDFEADDLAGLACEAYAQSRLVHGNVDKGDWAVRYGPFEESDFENLPQNNWTLLVQDVEKHYPPLSSLMEPFRFLPDWRLDDLMISFAAPGGSVGPHVDQYDVFLLQLEGERCWQISSQFSAARLNGVELDVLKHFEPQQEWLAEPGSVLYLPANVAHYGVARTPCLTASVGLRAPSASDLLVDMAELLADQPSGGGRYRDPSLNKDPRAGEVDSNAVLQAAALLRGADTLIEDFDEFLAAFLSRYRLAHDPLPAQNTLTADVFNELLSSGVSLERNPWTRLTWIERNGRAILFAAGERHECSIDLAIVLCSERIPNLQSFRWNDVDKETMTTLVNAGHFKTAR